MTTYNIADLKTPADFTAKLTFGHLQSLCDQIASALNRSDLNVWVDCDGGYAIEDANTDGPDQLVGNQDCINIHIAYEGHDFDSATEKGVWDILIHAPTEDNSMFEWTNSYMMIVSDIDMENLEEVAIENGNPRMFEILVDRINYWLPKL